LPLGAPRRNAGRRRSQTGPLHGQAQKALSRHPPTNPRMPRKREAGHPPSASRCLSELKAGAPAFHTRRLHVASFSFVTARPPRGPGRAHQRGSDGAGGSPVRCCALRLEVHAVRSLDAGLRSGAISRGRLLGLAAAPHLKHDRDRGKCSDHATDLAGAAEIERAKRTPGDELAPAAQRGSVHQPERPLRPYCHYAEESPMPGRELAQRAVRAVCAARGMQAE